MLPLAHCRGSKVRAAEDGGHRRPDTVGPGKQECSGHAQDAAPWTPKGSGLEMPGWTSKTAFCCSFKYDSVESMKVAGGR